MAATPAQVDPKDAARQRLEEEKERFDQSFTFQTTEVHGRRSRTVRHLWSRAVPLRVLADFGQQVTFKFQTPVPEDDIFGRMLQPGFSEEWPSGGQTIKRASPSFDGGRWKVRPLPPSEIIRHYPSILQVLYELNRLKGSAGQLGLFLSPCNAAWETDETRPARRVFYTMKVSNRQGGC